MTKPDEEMVWLTKDEISALSILAETVVNGGGVVNWSLPVSEQWVADLKSANDKLTEAFGGE